MSNENNLTFEIPEGMESLRADKAIALETHMSRSVIAELFAQGQVLLNGKPLLSYRRESLAKIMGRIEQESILFSDTIKENLTLGSDFNTEQLRAAIEHSMITSEIEAMPEKIDTKLSEGGASLSGGQRQRLSIARTLLRTPELILMDDITAAMDAITEERFWKMMHEHFPKSTMLIVTHRQATARTADRIIHL